MTFIAQQLTEEQREAIEVANAHLNNVGLPLYQLQPAPKHEFNFQYLPKVNYQKFNALVEKVAADVHYVTGADPDGLYRAKFYDADGKLLGYTEAPVPGAPTLVRYHAHQDDLCAQPEVMTPWPEWKQVAYAIYPDVFLYPEDAHPKYAAWCTDVDGWARAAADYYEGKECYCLPKLWKDVHSRVTSLVEFLKKGA